MIQMQSLLDVADNSGARVARCFKVLGGSKRRTASIGDVIVVSIVKALPNCEYSKRARQGGRASWRVARAVIVRTRKEVKRPDGSTVKFDTNACVLIKPDGEPIGTRIFGPVARELRQKNYTKIVSLASEVV